MPAVVAISPPVLRLLWPGFVPLGMWLCCLLLVICWGRAERRRLVRILLWCLPVFLILTALVAVIGVVLSRYPL